MHLCINVVAVKYVHDIIKVFSTETKKHRLYENILYVWLTLIMILSLNKFNLEKNRVEKNCKGWWWWRIGFTHFNSFAYFIDRVVIYDFSSMCMCMWHQLLSHNIINFQPLFLHNNLLSTSQRYLFSLCCGCIWLRKTLFPTRQTLIILPKGSIQYSTNLVSTKALFCSWSQISNILLYSLHDWHYKHCTLTVPR